MQSIKARIAVAILATILPIVAGLGYYIWQQYQDLVQNEINRAAAVATSTAAYDRNLFGQTRDLLVGVTQAPVVRNENWNACSTYLNQVVKKIPNYLNIGVISLDGRLVCSGRDNERKIGAYVGDRSYFNLALQKIDVTVSDFIDTRISEVPTLIMALRVPGHFGITVGIAYITINLDYLHVESELTKLQNGAKIWVLDRNGVVLHSMPDEDQLGSFIGYASDLQHGLIQREYTDEAQQKWLSFTMPTGPLVDKSALLVRYDVPKSSFFINADRYLWSGISFLLVLLLFVSIFAWFLMHLAAGKSLRELRMAVIRLANNDLTTRVADKLKGNELREIGKQFDVMAETIQRSALTLQQSEYGYRMLFESSPNPMLVLNIDNGKILAVNDEAIKIYGYSRKEFLGLYLADLQREILLEQPNTVYSRERHKRNDGSLLNVEVRSLSLLFTGQAAHVLLVRDVTYKETLSQDLKERDRLIDQLLDVTAEAIYGLDAAGCCIFANRACAELLGYDSPNELIGQHFHFLVHYKHEDGSPYLLEDCVMHNDIKQGKSSHVDDEVLWRRDGTCFPVEYWSYPIWNDEGLEFCLVTFLDISERRQQQQALKYQAMHDGLTGLLNRNEITRQMHGRIADPGMGSWILVMSNIDGFKEVNEALGHDAGDRLLIEIANRMRAELGSKTVLARVGGDEFAFILEYADLSMAKQQVQQLTQIVREPFFINDLQLRINTSFGMAQYPMHASDADELLRHADVTMRIAKRDGLGIGVYDPKSSEKSHERLALRGDLRAGLEAQQFILYLQPKIILSQSSGQYGDPVGFEALVRWNHPTRGMLQPGSFIPIIEVSDLIHGFTEWIVNQAIEYCAGFQSSNPGMSIAVNVSARNLLDVNFPDQIKKALYKHGLSPELLELEVTESALMVDPERALSTLNRVHDLGVIISIDDFGTGYSSFSYLQKLPVDILKIDQSFIFGMLNNPDMRTIVKSIIDMAHALGLKVVAEGIETQIVLDDLYTMGCDIGQGYFIGRPVPISDAYDWLNQASLIN